MDAVFLLWEELLGFPSDFTILTTQHIAAAAAGLAWCKAMHQTKAAAELEEAHKQARLLHDIFGPLPFRDVLISPAWLTSDVVTLARGIHDEKAFDRMPILADAIQDAGCDNDEILTHCRQPDWEHVRGCWLIDLLLGRPWRDERPGEPEA